MLLPNEICMNEDMHHWHNATVSVSLSRNKMSQDVKHSLKGGILPFTRPLLDAYLQCDFAFDIYLWHREDLWT